jgi:hypothetical protein
MIELTTGTALIMAGLLLVSIVAGLTVFIHLPFGKLPRLAVVALGVIILAVGIVIHVTAPASVSPSPAVETVHQTNPVSETGFTFSPKEAKWGQEVEVRVRKPGKTMEVYYNGLPLPARIADNGDLLVITIPSTSRSGYFMVKVDGKDIKNPEKLIVTP